MTEPAYGTLNTLEYYVLMALVGSPLYGYAIQEAVDVESGGKVKPGAGSLYRVLARMMARGFVTEVEPEEAVEPHPGLKRKYYALEPAGRAALRAEAARIRDAVELTERRLAALDSSA